MTQIKAMINHIETYVRAHSKLVLFLVLAVAAAIALMRRPEAVIQAQFWAEDGRYWYADAYNLGLESLFATYAGYFVLMYRLIAFATLALPLEFAPIAFNLSALALQLLPIVLLCSNRLSFVPKRWIGIVLSLLYICVPNSTEVFTNLTNIQWHLGIAAFLVLIAEPSKRLGWRIFDYAVLIATGLSGPLVIILGPIGLWMLWRKRGAQQRNNFIILVALALVQMIGIFFLSGENRVGAHAEANFLYFVQMIAGQIFTGGLLGQANVDITYGHYKTLYGLFVIGLAIIAYAAVKGPEWLRLAHAYSFMLIAAMLVSLKPVPGLDPWQGLTNPGGGQRYWYIPILIWIATLVWLAFNASWPFIKGVAITALSLLIIVGIPGDWRIGVWPYQHFRAYALQFKRAPPGTRVSIPINPGWDMVLYKK